MLAPYPEPMAPQAFLRWNQRQDERHELVDGLPLRMMAGAKQSHNVVVGNIADALRRDAKAMGCRTTSSDTAVLTGSAGVRYPDIVVDCGPPDPEALAASRPVILVEVLSPSTSQIDFSDKLDEYRGIASVETILLVDPDLVLVKAYRRNGEGGWRSEKYDDLGQSITLAPLGTALSLGQIYDTLDPRHLPRIGIVRGDDAS